MTVVSVLRKIKNMVIPAKVVKVTVVTSSPTECLKDRVIIVTGGATGIGRAIAKKAVTEKARVIIVGRREQILKDACKEIGTDYCKYMVCDLSSVTDYKGFYENAEKIFSGKIAALVNNAGIYIDKHPTDFTETDFDSTISINLKAPMFLTMEFVKYCVKNNIEGNVIVTASNRGMFGDYGPYGVSKRGVISYVEGMARELIGTGIRINAVAPGMTASEINGADITGNMYTASARGERILHPCEIAEIVCFLLSDYSKCITGAVIPCDEGDRLR